MPDPPAPAKSEKVAPTPAKTKPPAKAVEKQPARENTQELPLISQCGGESDNVTTKTFEIKTLKPCG